MKTRKHSAKRRTSKKAARRIHGADHHDGQVIIMGKKRAKRRRSSGYLMGGNAGQVGKRMLSNGVNVVCGIGGGIAGAYLSNMIPVKNAKIKAAIPTIAGIAIASLVSIPAVKFAGIGLGVVGGLALLKQFIQVPMIAGSADVVYLPAPGPDAVELGALAMARDGSAPESMGYVTQNDL